MYVCIGVPYFIGERLAERTEVEAIEKSGIAQELNAPWITIEPDFASAPDPLTAVNRALAQTITAHADRVPIIFSSDCSTALGAVKGLEKHNPAVIWFDAHGDFNTDETSPSGFLGGMPLAMLVGRGNMTYMNGVGLKPLPEQRVIITDARDLDPEERNALKSSEVTRLVSVEELLTIQLMRDPHYIHFDLDVIDLEDMPGMNYPSPGGPSVATCEKVLRHIREQVAVVGLMFKLWNDSLPTQGKSLATTLALTRAITS